MNQRASRAWLAEWEYAHRGLHRLGVPENSLAAADAAIAAGMGIECDIQRSFDDEPVVFHDWELERLTGETGDVADRIADALEQSHLLGTNQTPIRLTGLLEHVSGRVPLLVEIKSLPDYDVEWTCVKVESALRSYRGAYAVMSFDPRVAAWFAANAPAVVRGLVGTDTLDNGFRHLWHQPGAIDQANPDFLAIDIRDLPNAPADKWRASGKPLLSWTVRTSELRAHALQHADALISEGEGLV